MYPNLVDVALVLLVALSAYSGYSRGLLLSLLDLVRWIGGWLLAIFLYRPVSNVIGSMLGGDEAIRIPIVFLSLVVLFGIVIQVVGWRLLRRIPAEYHMNLPNKLLGIIPGLFNGLILAAIIAGLLFALPLSDSFAEQVQDSRVAGELAVVTDTIENTLTPIFEPALRQTLTRIQTIEPDSNEVVELPFKVTNAKPAPELEEQMLELVNQERTSRGLKPLVIDEELRKVARAHSEDMFVRGYFSHYTPEGKDPFDRMREAGVNFRTAGENLALAPTLQLAHTGLMNSPGHRANILHTQFGRVGIGILDGGRRGIMVSQEFRN
ncbi:MAG: CvpA family protein [Acidobacteria bacterium]|nr:CvpA family protein [Acidobacteriota bacterium]